MTENTNTTKTVAPKTAKERIAAGAPQPAKRKTAKPATKSAAKPVEKKVAPAKKTANGKTLIAATAVIKWIGPNKFKEGSEVHDRVELVRRAAGKTREAIEAIKGVRTTTVPNLVRMGLCAVA
jgi:hypothetical protein